MEFTLLGMLIDDRLLHPLNALPPMTVVELGIVIVFKELQPPNAYFPIVLMLPRIVTFDRLVHPRNASSFILVTVLGIEILPV